MMEENNDIFFVGGNALVFLAKPIHKKYSTTLFGAIHLVRTYLVTKFSTPLLQYAPVHILHDPYLLPQLRT